MFDQAYRGKSVLVTGHTGFKGSWLCLWLELLGANVTGVALAPATSPNLFTLADISQRIDSRLGDVRDTGLMAATIAELQPDFVFHLAAQALVYDGLAEPAATFATNLTGSINLLEALRAARSNACVVMVTSDKVYRNNGTGAPLTEDDPLGGTDPYSASKAGMELAVAAWRASFPVDGYAPRIATVRAGNVIGGGDWAAYRIVPDLVRALAADQAPALRSPRSVRPWQHVLDPLCGYLQLGAALAREDGSELAGAFNFGPLPTGEATVEELVNGVLAEWGRSGWHPADYGSEAPGTGLLRLSIAKAERELGWQPLWSFAETVERTARWYREVLQDPQLAHRACLRDLADYCDRLGSPLRVDKS